MLLLVYPQDGRSPLIIAALYGHKKIVRKLLRANADVNIQDKVEANEIAIKQLFYYYNTYV